MVFIMTQICLCVKWSDVVDQVQTSYKYTKRLIALYQFIFDGSALLCTIDSRFSLIWNKMKFTLVFFSFLPVWQLKIRLCVLPKVKSSFCLWFVTEKFRLIFFVLSLVESCVNYTPVLAVIAKTKKNVLQGNCFISGRRTVLLFIYESFVWVSMLNTKYWSRKMMLVFYSIIQFQFL